MPSEDSRVNKRESTWRHWWPHLLRRDLPPPSVDANERAVLSASMPSEESGVNKQEATCQAEPVASSHSMGPFTPPPPSANANERPGLSQSHPSPLIGSRNVIINGGHFNHVTHINQGSPADSRSSFSNEIRHISPAQISGQSSQVDHERDQSQVSSQSREISFQESNVIYERHLTLKGRGFPLWIPDSNLVLHLDYRRTGVRIGDVGIITDGAFSFLFNICLPHNDPVNPRTLPEHFAPISPPIEATDIDKFIVFNNGSYLSSASVKRSQTGATISDIVFESSASDGAILTMPRGARSENLRKLARFREYAAANVANWYRFVNGPRGREAKNGDVRLVVGFDKTTSWGIATFTNQTQQNSCRLKFGPSEGDSAITHTWSENSGVADVKAGPDSDQKNELRIVGDPPDVQFENQCLFVRTLNVTLTDHVWADIHSSSGSIPVDSRNSQYPRVNNFSDSNRPHSNNSGNGSNFFSPPSQGAQSGTQRRLQGVDITSDKNPPIFVSGPVESITAHPSKVINDTLLAKIPTAKMVITHDDDWSSVTQYDTLPDPHEFVANILATRDIYQENGVVFLEPKKITNEISEGSTSVNRPQEPKKMVNEISGGSTSVDRSQEPKKTVNEISGGSTSVNRSQGVEPMKIINEILERFTPHLFPKRIQLEDISPDDIIIVVIGPSQAGKSTFINTATGKPLLRVNNGLEPCTTKVEHVRCTIQFERSPKQVVFVDTPAFPASDPGSDNTIAGLDVEMKIQNWVRQTFRQKNIKITGILYLHKINDNRMTQPPFPHYQMFQGLCGEGFHARVLLVTTMWEKLPNRDVGERRKVILEGHWRKMIDKGSAVVCHNGNKQSAWDVVMALLGS